MGLSELGLDLVALAAARGLTLGLAESCTGGLVADTITNVPGSSAVFDGAVVAYANEVKEKVLGVSPDLLVQHGAVSEEVALAMAQGARRLLGSDVALGVTGVAGPGGGTSAKPVGLVCIGVVGPWGELTTQYRARGDRVANKRRFAEVAIDKIISFIGTSDEAGPPVE